MKGKSQSKAKKTLKAKPAVNSKVKAKTKVKAKVKSAGKKLVARKPAAQKSASVAKANNGKKTTSPREKKNTPIIQPQKSALFTTTEKDPAHSPGHRKMNLKDKFAQTSGVKNQPQNMSAVNNMSRADLIQRQSGTNRRIITGAAMGKTGRITIKD